MTRAGAVEAAGLVVFVIGGACVVYGVSRWSAPLAWVLAGLLVMMAGAVAARLANGGDE